MNKTEQRYQKKLETRRKLISQCESWEKIINKMESSNQCSNVDIRAALSNFCLTLDQFEEARNQRNIGGTFSYKYYKNFYNRKMSEVYI